MQSLLLGLGDIIADAMGFVMQKIAVPIVEMICKFLIAPIIRLLFEVIMAVFGIVLYHTGCFMLQLIDFVEITFRALAGMESVDASGMSMSLSLDGGSGDILIQLIRHPDIQSAFVAMCVVGLFLLVVTTVFQIIKVEYTTEGAKNAKGPIFQKAFKGLANLMLLPMLVIFGIVFANQLLGLLDSATKGSGENPTISGLIFVSSAHEAHYLEGELQWEIVPGYLDVEAVQGILQVVADFVADIVQYGVGGWTGDADRGYANSNIDEIESGFISQTEGHKYYLISDVTDYYNYVNINYLLWYFGACFALKTLYYSCFGMIIRLYKCAVLFIISPAIIGMTPVNEGGLGKWRTAFIGQVLSAYGTVLALNLYFIIVRVLLSVEVQFSTSAAGGLGSNGFLGSTFMTLLLKCLFVIAGCMLIEKFAKEIGAYFGADDALGAGKGMAKEMEKAVTDTVMAGVTVATTVAAGVATGGASLAASGAALAGKLASSTKKGTGPASQAQFKQQYRKEHSVELAGMSKEDQKKMADNAWKEEKGIRQDVKGFSAEERKTAKNTYANYKEKYGEDGGLGIASKNLDEAKAGLAEAKTPEERRLAKDKYKKAVGDHKKAEARNSQMHVLSRQADLIATDEAEQKAKQEKREERNAKLERFGMKTISAGYGLAMKGKEKLPGMGILKQFNDAATSGAKALGDPFVAATDSVNYNRDKKVQDTWQNMPGAKELIDAQNTRGAAEVSKEFAKEFKSSIEMMAANAERIIKSMGDYMKTNPNLSADEKGRAMFNALNQINANGASMDMGKFQSLVSQAESGKEIDVNVENDLKIKIDDKAINDAISRAMKNGALTPEALRKELQDVFKNLGKDGEANLMKIITDAISKVAGQLGGK